MFKKTIAAGIAFLLLSLNIYAQTPSPWLYLDSQPPGPHSALAYSISGKSIRAEVPAILEQQFLTWQDSDLPSVTEYETALLSLIKLGQNPADYKGRDLFSALYPTNTLEVDGLDGISGALLVYGVAGDSVAHSQPNSPNALLDRIIGAQQPSGGFSQYVGDEPIVSVTARAITALFPYQDTGSDVRIVIEKGLSWMLAQQNADGTFSVKGLPSGCATAQVLTAAALYPSTLQTLMSQKSIETGMEAFRNSDGGYSETLGGQSSARVTEMAIIAQNVCQTKSYPYYAPESFETLSVSSVEAKDSSVEKKSSSGIGDYFKFLVLFCLIFFLVYLLLMLTIKIGKYAEKKKLPGSLAAEAEKAAPAESPQIHIPMQAQIPNFDDCSAQELEIGHSNEDHDK